MKKVTVLLPVYNAEKFIKPTIKSILSQTFTDFDFIIINDGSSDNSLSILEDFQKLDSRIKIISRENKGLIQTLNEGIKLSNSTYIARIDADDITHPKRLEWQVSFMEANKEIGFCGTYAKAFLSQYPFIQKKIHYPLKDEDLKVSLFFRNSFIHPSIILRKNILDANNFLYDNYFKGLEDYELWTRMSKICKCANIDKDLIYYRIHKKSITQSSNSDRNQDLQRLLRYEKLFDNYFKSYNIQLSSPQLNLHTKTVLTGIYNFPETSQNQLLDWVKTLENILIQTGCFDKNSIKNICTLQTHKIKKQNIRLFVRKFI